MDDMSTDSLPPEGDVGSDSGGGAGNDAPKGMERRLVLRLLTHWRELVGERDYPSFSELDPASIPDIWSYCFVLDIDGHLVVPFIPLKWWFPYLPRIVFIPFMVVIIVAGANAVNLTDGMDSLATVPILTCTLFVASVAYVGADPDLARRLRVPLLSPELRELVIFGAALLSAGLAFLRYNAPPAMITMGDMGALALGSTFSAMFIFAKVELFLPLVGGVLVLTTLSTIIQRVFFKLMLWLRGREVAERIRFFYR